VQKANSTPATTFLPNFYIWQMRPTGNDLETKEDSRQVWSRYYHLFNDLWRFCCSRL